MKKGFIGFFALSLILINLVSKLRIWNKNQYYLGTLSRKNLHYFHNTQAIFCLLGQLQLKHKKLRNTKLEILAGYPTIRQRTIRQRYLLTWQFADP